MDMPLLALFLLACSPTAPDPGTEDRTPDTGTPYSTSFPTTPTWDPTQPEALRGSILRVEVSCGLLEGTPVRAFRKVHDNGIRWEMLLPAEPDVHPEVLPCTTDSPNYLDWREDGDLEVLASDLWHELSPTATPNRWVGTTWPLSGSDPDCDASLAQLGLEWPVHLSMTVLEILPPE